MAPVSRLDAENTRETKELQSQLTINMQQLRLSDTAKYIDCYGQCLTSEGIRLLKLFKIQCSLQEKL